VEGVEGKCPAPDEGEKREMGSVRVMSSACTAPLSGCGQIPGLTQMTSQVSDGSFFSFIVLAVSSLRLNIDVAETGVQGPPSTPAQSFYPQTFQYHLCTANPIRQTRLCDARPHFPRLYRFQRWRIWQTRARPENPREWSWTGAIVAPEARGALQVLRQP